MQKEEIERLVEQAKIQAQDFINALDPEHITSWIDLLIKIEMGREAAYREAYISDQRLTEKHVKSELNRLNAIEERTRR